MGATGFPSSLFQVRPGCLRPTGKGQRAEPGDLRTQGTTWGGTSPRAPDSRPENLAAQTCQRAQTETP